MFHLLLLWHKFVQKSRGGCYYCHGHASAHSVNKNAKKLYCGDEIMEDRLLIDGWTGYDGQGDDWERLVRSEWWDENFLIIPVFPYDFIHEMLWHTTLKAIHKYNTQHHSKKSSKNFNTTATNPYLKTCINTQMIFYYDRRTYGIKSNYSKSTHKRLGSDHLKDSLNHMLACKQM